MQLPTGISSTPASAPFFQTMFAITGFHNLVAIEVEEESCLLVCVSFCVHGYLTAMLIVFIMRKSKNIWKKTRKSPIFLQHSLFFFQAIINSTITPNMTFTKTSQKFGQWADSRANTVYGLGFSSEHHLSKVSMSNKNCLASQAP